VEDTRIRKTLRTIIEAARSFLYCSLFNDALSTSDYTLSNDWLAMNWNGCGKKWSCPILMCSPRILLKALNNTTDNVDNRYQELDAVTKRSIPIPAENQTLVAFHYCTH
jgi:hypothetical protein